MLEKLGINPVTLDNDSNFESLESLYVLAKEKAQNDYFDIENQDIPMPELPPQMKIITGRRLSGKTYW